LAARDVDFVISRFARPVGEEYSEEILFHDALVVVTGPSNPLARRRKIEFSELVGEPWVLDPRITHFGAMQAEVFRAAGLDPLRLTVAASSIASATGCSPRDVSSLWSLASHSSCRTNILDLKHCP
jgi:DNA-binding transcriptional LysR family regulator